MIQPQDFKENVFDAVWNHGKALIKPIAILVVIVSIIAFAITYFALSSLLSADFVELIFSGGGDLTQMMQMQEEMTYMMEDLLLEGGLSKIIGGIVIFFLVMTLIQSWINNLFLTISEHKLLNGEVNIGEAVKESFSKNIFTIWFAYLLIIVMFTVGSVVVTGLVGLTKIPILVILAVLFIMILGLRMLAVVPAIVHGKMTVTSAIGFSWSNITFGRALKILGVGIVAIIVLAILGAILQAIGGFIGSSIWISQGLSAVLNIFTYSFMFAALTALFFRYADIEIEGGESAMEEHLVEE